jgi:hypothetical protein
MNSIMIIRPYKKSGNCMFDDPSTGLCQELFVAGIDTILDVWTGGNLDGGFGLVFSETPFPGHTLRLDWIREEGGGNWYRWREKGLEGWLCPALFHYFAEAPKAIYAVKQNNL